MNVEHHGFQKLGQRTWGMAACLTRTMGLSATEPARTAETS
jgi:hypothetical protein